MRIIKHFKKFQNTSIQELAPQVVVIARNEAISLLRKRKGDAPLEDWGGFAETSETANDYHALVGSFTRLPQKYRAVMEMKLLLGYSDGEIAVRLLAALSIVRGGFLPHLERTN